jgi:hypothetical protein
MRLPESEIKAAILNSDQIVRDVALEYFTLSFSRDRSIMPVAMQAIENYGWDAFYYGGMVQNLPQTDQTLMWLIGQLDGARRPSSTAHRIRTIIVHADAEVLGRHESRLTDYKLLDGDVRRAIRERLRLLSVPGDTCWKELEDLCEKHKDDKDSERFDFGQAHRLVEAISREGDRYADRALSVLSQKLTNSENSPLAWLEIFMAQLAGLIRLEAAAPLLVAKLKDDDGDFLNEECTYALTKIGGDAAIEAVAKDFHSAPWHYQLYASSALQDMRGEKVVAKALELLKDEKDGTTQEKFIGAALANFDTEGVRLAKEFGVYDLPEIRRELVAVATLTGESFPELEELRKEVQEDFAAIQRWQERRLGDGLTGITPRMAELIDAPFVPPLRSSPKVGRNDPCPCGSGKKYKKCCLGKD